MSATNEMIKSHDDTATTITINCLLSLKSHTHVGEGDNWLISVSQW